MDITRAGSKASAKGPDDWFPARAAGAAVSDVVWFAPDEKHWHGASSATAMTHIAVQEQLDGKAVAWLEHVTDEQYRGR